MPSRSYQLQSPWGCDMQKSTMLRTWALLSPWPGGRWLFSRLLGYAVPYSGSIGARVVSLAPGQVSVELADRRRVRNHLRSIHAIALANLGEMASGLAMYTRLPDHARGIVTRIDIEYLKKARGLLRADGQCHLPAVNGPLDHQVSADIHDQDGDLVARIRVNWRLDRKADR